MAYKYIVVHKFGPHKKGDEIADPKKIEQLSEHQKKRCVRVAVPDEAVKEIVPPAPIGATKAS